MLVNVDLMSLFLITLAALVCPMLSSILPNKIIPETVFLLVAGMVLGPNVLDLVHSDIAINLLSDLGLGFLFLLAGYEIDVRDLSGKGGKHGLITWFVTFALALAVSIPLGIWRDNIAGGLAIAIALTTTAFGTLVPILQSRGLTQDTPVGRGVIEYGVWGELCPILAMALLLTTRAKWITILLLGIFVVVAVLAGVASKSLKREGSKLDTLMRENSETNSQMSVRAVVMLMVGLVTLSAIFDLDIVLGAFAAGFVLRVVIPKGDMSLEHKLDGLGYGFFIPLFFIVSGMKIDPAGVVTEPILLLIFIVTLMMVRAVPILVSLRVRSDTRELDPQTKNAIALYCTTALPLIVAVVSVATSTGTLSAEIGSMLISAGGITVLLMPLLASIAMHTIDAELGSAAKEIAADPKGALRILRKHRHLERERAARRKRSKTPKNK